jgi:hypothetical protein
VASITLSRSTGKRRLLAMARAPSANRRAVKIFENGSVRARIPYAAHVGGLQSDVPPRASTGSSQGPTPSPPASSRSLRLSYRYPALVAAMLEDSGLEPSRASTCSMQAAERACAVRSWSHARRLPVSISPRACWVKRKKNVYDAGEGGGGVPGDTRRSAIVSDAGLFLRLGDVLAAAAGALRPDLLIFTLGHAVGGDAPRLSPRAARPLQPLPRVCRTAAHRRRTGAGDRARQVADGIGSAGGGAGDSSDEIAGSHVLLGPLQLPFVAQDVELEMDAGIQ